MNAYVEQVIERVKKRDKNEPEFIQTVEEVLKSLEVVIDNHPEYQNVSLLERLIEPERIIQFRVVWVDDRGKVNVNRGYRVQFSSAIGPYKGGIRFHPSVYLGIMKFLAFEQTLKNSLTGLPIGGGKGGSDFDPRGKSDGEIMRFCQAFMTELEKYIGPDIDIPAGDIGVGSREIGYLFGQYKRIKGAYENGVITGKGLSYGGSLVRPEATGYGAGYYTEAVFEHQGESIEGKTFGISGFGNVAWGTAKKISDLGGRVITISGPDGYIYDPDGIGTEEKLNYMVEMRASGRDRAEDFADKFGVKFVKGKRPWCEHMDVAMPCATQNEVDMEDVKMLTENGTRYFIEVSNMPTTNEALKYLQECGIIVAPSKAVNAGGVAASALEMTQNAIRYSWDAHTVDEKLKHIMRNIHDNSVKAAYEYGLGYNLVSGANIAGFKKVAEAMLAQGFV